jgi:hypothetical protein
MKTVLGLLLTAVVLLAPSAASAVVINGGFETPEVAIINTVPVGGSIGAWAVVGVPGGSVHHISNAYTESDPPVFFIAQEGDQHVDLTGPGNQGANGVQQAVATDAGTAYTLSFWVGNQDDAIQGYEGPSSISLLIEGAPAGVFVNAADDMSRNVTWRQFFHNFVASDSSTTITFLNATPTGNNYAGLDNVVLAQRVPEPTSLLLLGAPLLGMAVRRLGRRGE